MSGAVNPGSVTVHLLRDASGRAVQPGDVLAVWYAGRLVDGGAAFDANRDFGSFTPIPGRTPFTFELGSGQVIQGWDQGLLGLRLGQVVELNIPAALAYGVAGSPPSIPPNADLSFTVELIGALPKGQSEPVYPTFRELGLSSKESSVVGKLSAGVEANKSGTDADNQLVGTDQPDLLIGFAGNDALTGGLGADVLLGGKDADRYVLSSLSDSPAGKGRQDSLVGFNAKAGDRVDLSALDGTLTFIKGRRFSGEAGEVRFKAGLLQLDADGDRNADLALQLPGVSRFSAGALIL